jgi:TolA-binding protein
VSVDGQSNDLDTHVAENVARVVSASTGQPLSPAAAGRSFDLLERRVATRRRRIRAARVTLVAAAALIVGVGGYRQRARLFGPASTVLSYRVGDGPALRPGDFLEAADDPAGTDVAFSDGTRVRLEPRARGRVVDLDGDGARVALYAGRAHVDVRHRANARWLFQAGPFDVRVHGTAFTIAWNPATTHFDLVMESGVVSVAGPISGGEMVVHAGESLSIGLNDGAGATGSAAQAKVPPVEDAPGAAEAAAPAPRGPTEPRSARRRDVAMPDAERVHALQDWRAALADGHAGAVVADAQRRGLARVLEAASSEDLAALADAARYIGDGDLARRALLVQRRRFPGSSRAAEASFLLGRLDDESAGTASALSWYDRYLAEAPAGAYVSEALGRKMMALERAHRRDEAVAIASDYLRRFPRGSYAHAAGVLVGRAGPPGGTPSPRR